MAPHHGGYRRRSPDTIASLIGGVASLAALVALYDVGSSLARGGQTAGSRSLLVASDYGLPVTYSSSEKVRPGVRALP